MGATSSKNADSPHGGDRPPDGGSQLYVSIKMERFKAKSDLIPHVYGSAPIGSWDPSEALPMEKDSPSMWQLSFVVPSNHETLDFKFLLKPRDGGGPCVVEEGPNRLLTRGNLEGDARAAVFRPNGDEGAVVEYRVFIVADIVSPFDLAASWRAYRENMQPSTVRGIPDVSINAGPDAGCEDGTSASLELDLEQYLVPPPLCANSSGFYAANLAETPRTLERTGVFSENDASRIDSNGSTSTSTSVGPVDHASPKKDIKVVVSDHSNVLPASGMVQSKSVGTISPLQKQDGQTGLFVDRGVGSPRLAKSASASAFPTELKSESETKKAMPSAAGAVAAGAVADQILGQKEDSHLAIVLVGLPARGKTFTAAKLTRYLRWLGHETKHFNVGKYRRLKHGANQSADFFRFDNPEGMEARNEVAALAMDDMTSWMQEGGQVGIFDATNSTRQRRNMLMKMAEGKCKIIFLETICNDEHIIERNIRLKIQQSPDYADQPDFEAGLRDFKTRLVNYEKAYEPVEEGSYIKMIDMVSGHGGQIQVNNISGYLPGRIVFFLVNTHLTPRPILLTRHGESRDNVRGRIGGDSVSKLGLISVSSRMSNRYPALSPRLPTPSINFVDTPLLYSRRRRSSRDAQRLTVPSAIDSDNVASETSTSDSAISETAPAAQPEVNGAASKPPLTAREKLRAARVLSRYTADSKPAKPGLGSRVLDALRESDGVKGRSGLPQAPTNLFDDSKRGMPKKGLTFDLPGGSDLFFIALSFVLISAAMFTTTYVVWKLGAIHFNEY